MLHTHIHSQKYDFIHVPALKFIVFSPDGLTDKSQVLSTNDAVHLYIILICNIHMCSKYLPQG